MEPILKNATYGMSGTPVIGISGSRPNSRSVQAMQARVRESGAIPLLLANHGKRDPAKDIDKFDAAIILGNNFDVDPADYINHYPKNSPKRQVHPKTRSVRSTPESASRAKYEKLLIDLVLEQKMPLFAICGGMHMINVRHGGTLHQHIPDLLGHDMHSRNAGQEASDPVIPVNIVEGTLLSRIAAMGSIYAPGFPPITANAGTVNTFHHQAVDDMGRELIACAYSATYTNAEGREDKLIEAIEADPNGKYKDQFLLGVQWHPEFLPDNPSTQRVLNDVRSAAAIYAKQNGRVHTANQVQSENILSAMPMLKEMSNYRGRSLEENPMAPPTPGRPSPSKGRSR